MSGGRVARGGWRILIALRRFWVPFDKSEGVVKTDFFSAMLYSTVWISERWRTEDERGHV